MSEWGVVAVIVTLIGLFLSVGKPIITLNSNIVRLNCSITELHKEQEEQKEALKQQKEKAHDAHQRIWEHEKEQDAKLADHSDRLEKLEGKK